MTQNVHYDLVRKERSLGLEWFSFEKKMKREQDKLLDTGLPRQTASLGVRGMGDGPETQRKQCKLTDDCETDSPHNATEMHHRQKSGSTLKHLSNT